MTVVGCRVPAPEVDLWDEMDGAVRRHGEDDDGRLLVADSKLVYNPGKGLHSLECGVLGFLCGASCLTGAGAAADLVEAIYTGSLAELREEVWFDGTTRLPVVIETDCLQAGVDGWRMASAEGELHWGLAAGVLVSARRLNGLVDKWGSKGAVLALALAELLQHCLNLDGREPVEIIVDKHGGRNFYSALLQNAFPDGLVLCARKARTGVYMKSSAWAALSG